MNKQTYSCGMMLRLRGMEFTAMSLSLCAPAVISPEK